MSIKYVQNLLFLVSFTSVLKIPYIYYSGPLRKHFFSISLVVMTWAIYHGSNRVLHPIEQRFSLFGWLKWSYRWQSDHTNTFFHVAGWLFVLRFTFNGLLRQWTFNFVCDCFTVFACSPSVRFLLASGFSFSGLRLTGCFGNGLSILCVTVSLFSLALLLFVSS